MLPQSERQNIVVLSVIFLFALLANVVALPVILFRRTKFGNGLFAVLILCLTLSDLAVTFFSILGSLIVEASDLLWGGATGSCQVYHWLSAWTCGLSAYLLVALVGMVMVKRSESCLQRLRDCRWLLLSLLTVSGLYALPELFVRTHLRVQIVDINDDNSDFEDSVESSRSISPETLERDICILGAPSPLYGLYVAYRLVLRHILPAILVFIAMVHPETNFSKRVSYLFFGHLSAPCACGENESPLSMPHECPNMQTAMLKSAAENISLAKPDLLADSEPGGCLRSPGFTKLKIQSEDPHRKMYKKVLSIVFIILTAANLILDIAYQIQSASLDANSLTEEESHFSHGQNLVTSLYTFSHLQQICNPIIFMGVEFLLP